MTDRTRRRAKDPLRLSSRSTNWPAIRNRLPRQCSCTAVTSECGKSSKPEIDNGGPWIALTAEHTPESLVPIHE